LTSAQTSQAMKSWVLAYLQVFLVKQGRVLDPAKDYAALAGKAGITEVLARLGRGELVRKLITESSAEVVVRNWDATIRSVIRKCSSSRLLQSPDVRLIQDTLIHIAKVSNNPGTRSEALALRQALELVRHRARDAGEAGGFRAARNGLGGRSTTSRRPPDPSGLRPATTAR
jgi:hypothetical protein